MKIEKAYEITDARISFVSLVDKAANKRQFLITKAENGAANFTSSGRILKADAENHYVTGIVYEPLVEDCHGNYMTAEEITKAAYWYAKNGDKVDIQHSFNALENATVVENWIAKADFEVDGENVTKGTWLMTIEVTDPDVWEGIQKGEITGLSMGGIGNYSEEDTTVEKISKAESKNLFKRLGEALGMSVVEKSVTEDYNSALKNDKFWAAFDALQRALKTYDYYDGKVSYETDEETIRTALEEFNAIIVEVLNDGAPIAKSIQPNDVTKSGKKMSRHNKEALNGIYENLGNFIKAFDDEPEDDPEKTEEEEDTDKDKPAENPDDPKNNKEEKELTKSEVETIVSAAIAKALGQESNGTQEGTVEKAATGNGEVTAESIGTMVSVAIAKAMQPQEEAVSINDVQSMIDDAVTKAVSTVLKSRNTPSNLSGITKSAPTNAHYMHGIL